MSIREAIRTALRLCYDEKSTLAAGSSRSERVYELYRDQIEELKRLAEEVKNDPEKAREVLRILVEELYDYPVRCSLLVDTGLRENIKDSDPRLAKVALFLMRREYSEEAIEELMKSHKGKALLAGRIEERIKNAVLRRLDGSTYIADEYNELKKLLEVAERLTGYIEKRILERRKRIVECISK